MKTIACMGLIALLAGCHKPLSDRDQAIKDGVGQPPSGMFGNLKYDREKKAWVFASEWHPTTGTKEAK